MWRHVFTKQLRWVSTSLLCLFKTHRFQAFRSLRVREVQPRTPRCLPVIKVGTNQRMLKTHEVQETILLILPLDTNTNNTE